jgi:hypothetical protein
MLLGPRNANPTIRKKCNSQLPTEHFEALADVYFYPIANTSQKRLAKR